jgi:hypothetical protein
VEYGKIRRQKQRNDLEKVVKTLAPAMYIRERSRKTQNLENDTTPYN